MEDINFKRMMIALVLSMAILYGWMFLTGKLNPKPQQPPAAAPAAVAKPNQPAANPATGGAAQISQTQGAWGVQKVTADSNLVILGDCQNLPGGYKSQIVIDPADAAISEVRLSEHKNNVTDKEFGYSLLEAVTDQNGKNFSTLMLGELRLAGRAERFDLSRGCWKRLPDQPQTPGDLSARFAASITDPDGRVILEIIKAYGFRQGVYDLQFELTFVNHTASPIKIDSLELFGPTGIHREDPQRNSDRQIFAAYLAADQQVTVSRGILNDIASKPETANLKIQPQSLFWFGLSNRFFAAVLCPKPNLQTGRVDFFGPGQITAVGFSNRDQVFPDDNPMPLADKAVLTGPAAIEPGEKSAYAFDMYMGAIDKELFDNPAYPQYAQHHFEKLINVSWCAFDWLTFLLLGIMGAVYKFVGNYGVAIIILVLLVRLVLYPISKKSQVNMMKMSSLGPQMEEIKRKYAGNQQEIQKNVMALYKQQGATPILGCLPMALQMPILIALYTAVSTNTALRHHGLFPASWHWLTDLSAPDRLIPLSTFGIQHPIHIPLIGSAIGAIDAFNLLPILLTLAMYLQMKYSPQKSAVQTPQMEQQQKMMLYMMPAMMLLFFYSAPSGLNLYFMASTFCGLIEQHYIRKHLKKQKELKDAVTVAAPKKIKFGLGPKTKKPKPPFRFS